MIRTLVEVFAPILLAGYGALFLVAARQEWDRRAREAVWDAVVLVVETAQVAERSVMLWSR